MDQLWQLLTPTAFFGAVAVTLLGGIVKGAVGFAMPLVMISGMALFLDPLLVVAGIVVPIVVSNGLQVLRAGRAETLAALRDFRLYVVLVCVMILLSAQVVALIPTRTMYLVLGIPVVALCAIQLSGLRLSIPPERRTSAGVVAGLLAGTIGGLAGTWGPPTVLYLLALDTPKARQMAAQGVIYGMGSVALLVGHLQSGVLSRETLPFSIALVAPALLGMWIGFSIQSRLDQEKFRKLTLLVLIVAGLNLIRRGVFG